MDENVRVWPGDVSKGEAEVVTERVVWESKVARLCVATVRYPGKDGAPPAEREQFRLGHPPGQPDGAVVLAVNERDEVILVRQFRHPVRMWLRELPRGAGAAGERPEDTARRELSEETGATLLESWPLGRIVNDSGQFEGYPHLVLARVHEGAPAHPEAAEAIDRLVRYRFTELRAACERGEIVDSFTLCAVLRAGPHFDGDALAYRADRAPAS